jgi:hypothetical protein
MQLQYNRLTGTLNADVFNNLRQLQALYLYNNALSGELPTSVATLVRLVVLQLQHTKFNGGLDGVFDPIRQRSLAVVQLSSNQLQGTVSSDIFELPSLSTFALGSNCMQGPLPLSICESSSLQSLLLDGDAHGLFVSTATAGRAATGRVLARQRRRRAGEPAARVLFLHAAASRLALERERVNGQFAQHGQQQFQ